MNKQSVIYARVSTDEQTKGYSLQTQIEACKQYAVQQGYIVLHIFSEDYSGASLDRPELNNVRDFLAKEDVDVVIVYDVDRLARKSIYQALIEEEFLHDGAIIEYVIGQYADTDEGRLQKQIRGSIAEYEKAKILERSKRGKRGKAMSGFVLVGSRPPYGYKVISEPHKSWFEIDEEEAEVVRVIFDWYLRGDESGEPLSMNAIAVKLTDLGVPTRGDKQGHFFKKRGKGIWAATLIRNILKNETYTGTWYYGKTKMIDDGKKRNPKPKCGFGKQVMRARDEWIGVPVPMIIDEDTYKRAIARVTLNAEQADRSVKHQYLLGRRLRCMKCNYTYKGRTRHSNHYYYCGGTEQRPVKLCDSPAFRGKDVDRVVWNWLVDLIKNPQAVMSGLQDSQDGSVQENQALLDRLAMIERQIQDQDTQLGKILDLYLSGDFERDMLTERKVRLENNIANLRKEYRETLAMVEKVTLTDSQMTEIQAFCDSIRDRIDTASFEEKRQLLEMFDVRGKLTVENNEKVVYVSCLLEPQPVSLALTSHLSNTGATVITPCASRRTAPSR
jgi:site-specific DNA recombinase